MSDGNEPTWPDGESPEGSDQAASSPPPPPPPPPPPAPEASRGVGQDAELGVRIGARLIDHILLGIATSVILIPLVVGSLFDGVGTNSAFGFGTSLGSVVASLVSAALYIAYFAWFESNRGQTLGKQLLNLKVEGPGGGNPTMEQSVRRNLWIAAGIVPLIGPLAELALVVWIIVTISNGRGVHDEWAGGTRVVTA